MTDPRDAQRKLVKNTVLSTEGVDVDAAIERARWLLGLAFDLLLEDETVLTKSGRREDIFFGPWLTKSSGDPRQSAGELRLRLQAMVEGMLRSYFAHGTVPEIVHVQSLAAITIVRDEPVERTTLLPRPWAPRAQLLVPLFAALLSAEGLLPPLGAWGFSAHADWTGEDANAYGVHKEDGRRASERLISLDVLGGDARAAVAMLNFVTGMRDAADASDLDPKRLERSREDLAPFGIVPPSTPADHLAILLRFVRAAFDLLHRVAEGSRVLRTAEISAARVLDLGVPRWATVGPLAYGPYLGRADLSAPRYWPGTDPAALRNAREAGVRLLAMAFDSVTLATGEVPGLDRLILGEPPLAGRDLAEMLSSDTRQDELPALYQPPPAALRALAGDPRVSRLGIDIDPERVTALTLPAGHVRISERHGRPLPAPMALLSVASTPDARPPSGTLAWTSNVDLVQKARNAAIIVGAIHRLSLDPGPPLGGCSARMHKTFHLHEIKTGSYDTRCYLRVLAMLTNLVLVGEGRTAQAVAA